MARSLQQRRAGFAALLAYVQREDLRQPAGADVPQSTADLVECGIPMWAHCADTWPEPWRTMHADLERIPDAQRGEAEAALQRRFLRALQRVREDIREDRTHMPGPAIGD